MKLLKDMFEAEFASKQEAANLIKEFKNEVQSLDLSGVRETGEMYRLLIALAYADIEPFNKLPALEKAEAEFGINPYDYYIDETSWGVADDSALEIDRNMPKPQRDALVKLCSMVGIRVFEIAVDKSRCGAIDTAVPGSLLWYLENIDGSGYGPLDTADLLNIVWKEEGELPGNGFDEYTCWVIRDPKPEAFGFDPKVTGSNWEKIAGEDEDEEDEFGLEFDESREDRIRDYIWKHSSEFIKPLN